jgi:hypothetical protein
MACSVESTMIHCGWGAAADWENGLVKKHQFSTRWRKNMESNSRLIAILIQTWIQYGLHHILDKIPWIGPFSSQRLGQFLERAPGINLITFISSIIFLSIAILSPHHSIDRFEGTLEIKPYCLMGRLCFFRFILTPGIFHVAATRKKSSTKWECSIFMPCLITVGESHPGIIDVHNKCSLSNIFYNMYYLIHYWFHIKWNHQ